jgi:hypothetical protein
MECTSGKCNAEQGAPFGSSTLGNRPVDHGLGPALMNDGAISPWNLPGRTFISTFGNESGHGPLVPFRLDKKSSNPKVIIDAKAKRSVVFGSIALEPDSWKTGRYGLARTLLEILSFQPTGMRTRVRVWRLSRKASYSFPMPKSW